MKAVVRTDEYSIFQKRSERYAVRDKNRAWVNGDAKTAILLEHKLIQAPAPKAPQPVEEETVSGETSGETSGDAAAEGGEGAEASAE